MFFVIVVYVYKYDIQKEDENGQVEIEKFSNFDYILI